MRAGARHLFSTWANLVNLADYLVNLVDNLGNIVGTIVFSSLLDSGIQAKTGPDS